MNHFPYQPREHEEAAPLLTPEHRAYPKPDRRMRATGQEIAEMQMPSLAHLDLDCCTDDPDEMKAICRSLKALWSYASMKACALELRQKGNISSAEHFETACDRLYKSLPNNWKW